MYPLRGEDLIPLSKAHLSFPARISQRYAYRLAEVHPHRPTLETTRIGSRIFTSKEAIDRFLTQSNADNLAPKG